MNFKTKFKKNKGITLIALVVTIIVLLILAGISITMLTGQNGILNRAGEAKTTNGVAQGVELIKVSVMDALTRGTGELTDENLRKALSSNLGTEGKDYEIVGSEDCGWTVTIKGNDKDYKISSTGKIGEIEKVEGSKSDWEIEGNAVVKYLGNDKDIVIPNYVDGTKITEVGEKVFYNSEKTGTLTISEGIKTIDTYAFADSKFTGELILPNTIKTIRSYAFAGCNGFTGNLELPSSVETIENFSFVAWNGNTNDLIIPGSIKKIEDYAFCSCNGFKGKLTIKDGVQEIGRDAFIQSTGFNTLELGNTIKSIGQEAFLGCTGFTGELKIPNSVEIIEGYAFRACNGFTGELKIPNSLKKIGGNAFENCTGFTGDLIIPEALEEVGFSAFAGCTGIKGDLIISDNVTIEDLSSFADINFSGLIYIGKNVQGMNIGHSVSSKRVIMNSLIRDYATMQYFPNIESCWISSDIIKDIETIKMFTYEDTIKNKNMVIYTDATEDDENWPKDWNPNTLKVVYETSLDKYYELTD